MKFGLRAWVYGLAGGALLAALLAAVPTMLDWLENPGGIFRSGDATRWAVVWETFVSWFMPAVLLLAPFTVLAFAWLAGRRETDSRCSGCR
jgi:hypothetical protein